MGGVSKMTIYADVGWMGGSEKAQKIWSLMRCTEYTHSDSDSIMGFADCTVGPLLTYIATGLVLSRVPGVPGGHGIFRP